MSRTFFEETQTYRQAGWIWTFVISCSTFIMGIFLYGIYLQLILGQPWGVKPMSNAGLIIASLLVLLIVCLINWLIYAIKLEVKIDASAIHFRYFPHMQNWRSLSANEIEEYEIKKLGFFERGKRGYRGLFASDKKLIVLGWQALSIHTKDKRKVVIGTQSPAELNWAMKKLMTNAEPGL